MKNQKVVASRDRLQALVQRVGEMHRAATTEDLLRDHLNRYLCVLVSGFVEEAVRNLLTEYVRKRSQPDIAKYVAIRLAEFINPKWNNVLDLIGAFAPDCRRELETEFWNEARAAVDGIVSNRHQIAHGRDTGIGYVTVKRYFGAILKLVEYLDSRFSN